MSAQRFAEREFGGAELGDRRLEARVLRMAAAAMARPAASLPKMAGSDAELEATYRLLNHPRLKPEQVLAPHVRQTVMRCAKHAVVWVAHDTTDIHYNGESERENLGRVRNKKAGYEAHFSIGVLPGNETRQMLGVLEVQRFNNLPKAERGASRKPLRDDGEDDRWLAGVRLTERSLGDCTSAIHLMDRAADSYALWARMCQDRQRFVIRLCKSRKLDSSDKLFDRLDMLSSQPALLQREVMLSRRGKQKGSTQRRIHPPRDRRSARLEVRACAVDIPRPAYCSDAQVVESLSLNIVHVREVDAPEGSDPVDWKLVTTEPIGTAEQVGNIIDAYRGRWVIEEYFKALKTGCALQSRQLGSYEGLSMVLALLAPVAWRLLQLRSMANTTPDAPASTILTTLQIMLLRKRGRDPFPDNPTVADAHFAVARLGGFLKHNKNPGWQVLGRGMEELLIMEDGASALIESRCDQS